MNQVPNRKTRASSRNTQRTRRRSISRMVSLARAQVRRQRTRRRSTANGSRTANRAKKPPSWKKVRIQNGTLAYDSGSRSMARAANMMGVQPASVRGPGRGTSGSRSLASSFLYLGARLADAGGLLAAVAADRALLGRQE